MTPLQETSYVKESEEIKLLKKTLTNKEALIKILSQDIDLNEINLALNIENLKRVKRDIESNLDNDDEIGFWQPLFRKNTWVLSQLFSTPFMIMDSARYLGGKNINNSSGKETDFIYKNNITQNISLIEIKTPKINLLKNNDSYRSDVFPMSEDLSGSLSQILVQKNTLQKDYLSILNNSEEAFKIENLKTILIVGKFSDLNSVKKRTSFELIRSEMKSVEIICFDELLTKINQMIELFENKNVSEDNPNANKYDDLPF